MFYSTRSLNIKAADEDISLSDRVALGIFNLFHSLFVHKYNGTVAMARVSFGVRQGADVWWKERTTWQLHGGTSAIFMSLNIP
jgi:hypothetical protein